jgi:hypothetical protein
MVFGDRPPSDILATTVFNTKLLISDKGRSPKESQYEVYGGDKSMFGLSGLSMQAAHVSRVEVAIGFRLLSFWLLSHHSAS